MGDDGGCYSLKETAEYMAVKHVASYIAGIIWLKSRAIVSLMYSNHISAAVYGGREI